MRHYQLGDISFKIPSSYGELTFGQYQSLKNNADSEDTLKILSIMSELPVEVLQDSGDLFLFEKIAEDGTFDFLNLPFAPENFILPDKIEINGSWYELPGGIGINTLGQKIALQRYLDKASKDGVSEADCMPFVVALYMQPKVTGTPYNHSEVEKIEKDIYKCRLNEVWPIASFFLINYERSWSLSLSDYRSRRQANKSEQALKTSKSSVNYQRFGLCRRILIKLLNRFSWSRTTLSI